MDAVVLESGNDWRVETFVLILSRRSVGKGRWSAALIECVVLIYPLPQLSDPLLLKKFRELFRVMRLFSTDAQVETAALVGEMIG